MFPWPVASEWRRRGGRGFLATAIGWRKARRRTDGVLTACKDQLQGQGVVAGIGDSAKRKGVHRCSVLRTPSVLALLGGTIMYIHTLPDVCIVACTENDV